MAILECRDAGMWECGNMGSHRTHGTVGIWEYMNGNGNTRNTRKDPCLAGLRTSNSPSSKASTMHPQKGDSSRRPCRIQVSEAAHKPLEICPKDEEGIPKPLVVSENTIKMACLVSLVLLEVLGLYISINPS
jgi:hypothetical protein